MRKGNHGRKAFPLLLLLLLPFVVGFDMPDSSGVFVKASGGRGAYHVSGCHRAYNSEFVEGNVAMRATIPVAAKEKAEGGGVSGWSWLRPDKLTVGAFVNHVREDLTLVDAGSDSSVIGSRSKDRGHAGGAYIGLDWEWVGLDLGLGLLSALQRTPELGSAQIQYLGLLPMGGVRVGRENLFISGELASSSPLYTGAGMLQLGIGGRWERTRLWGGLASLPYEGDMLALKASQGLGPVTLFAAGALGTGEAKHPGFGFDREYGASLGLELRLSGLE